ncbi:CapA family protein [Mucilaginibacter sp. UR6-1]|uniref:CapA family protein n=1 Tax=Mucilaginibacter sp. UR6-1 TaxID=1435643 RepID=UPI001E53F6C7|nr:CapA family protein [Mucilaginibacter sp. UR6-1]MCC8410368.1 CapA family protein [Mucilaginibacter sp. UR6-1]
MPDPFVTTEGFFFAMYRNLLLYLFILLIIAGCMPADNRSANHQSTLPEQDTSEQVVIPPGDTISIAAVGDIMLGTSYPDRSTLPRDSGKNSFKPVLAHLQDADITFGNLEGVLLDTGAAADFKLHQRSKAYLFRMPESYGGLLKEAGFDLISLGNNHSNDFGPAGRKSTMRILDSLQIANAGLRSKPTAILKVKDITVGFCAFSPNSQTLSLLDLPNAAKIISELKQQTDIVIVSFHGGGEGTEFEHVTRKNESYKGENRGDVYAFAHNAIDAGADVVLGHGPHLTRAVELYNKRFIAYSMGNFCTYRGVNTTGLCGLAPLLKLKINKKGEFACAQIIATRQIYPKGIHIDTANRVIKRIKALSASDFPESNLNISNNGAITLSR